MLDDDTKPRIPPPRSNAHFVSRAAPPRSATGYRMRQVRKTESRRSGRRRQRTMVRVRKDWVIGLALVAVLILTSAGMWVVGRLRADEVPGELESSQQRVAKAPAKWQGPIPSVVAERFLEASRHDERLKWVRNPEGVGPAMEAFFSSGDGSRERVVATIPVQSFSCEGMVFEEFAAELEGGGVRLVSVLVDPTGAKVDFDSYSQEGSVSWEDLLSGKVKEGKGMKVQAKAGSFYLRGFSDEKRWAQFTATIRDVEGSVDLYLDRRNPALVDLSRMGKDPFRMTVSLRSVDGSGSDRQFEITEVEYVGWAPFTKG